MKEKTLSKEAIINSFKQLMRKKSFDKISISDITNNCYLNRQTFYYHFQDKYELMNYIYYNEIFLPLVENLDEENYDYKFCQMFEKMKNEQYLYANALSMNSDYGFKQYLFSVIEELVTITCENKKTIDIKFYTHGIVGVVIDWIQLGMNKSPKELSTWLKDTLVNFKKMS